MSVFFMGDSLLEFNQTDMFQKLAQQYKEAKRNKWLRYFTAACRIALALGFIPSGLVKIMGERFTGLPSSHPLGHYLDALALTGFYYPFIGVLQVAAALLLLIPRTALIGAFVYLPIITNICILDYATRFEGTRITTVMVLATLYLLCWDYDRIKYLFTRTLPASPPMKEKHAVSTFPWKFFAGVVVVIASVIILNRYIYEVRPGNSLVERQNGCADNKYPNACAVFCDCVYVQGKTLDQSIEAYENVKTKDKRKRTFRTQ